MNAGDRMLWMGDLETYMDANFIGEAFGKMGEEVKSVKVVYDKYSGRAAGYCFIELTDGDAARRAMLNISGKVIPKSKPPVTFNLSFANSPSAPYTEYNLFVNNLPLDLDDSGLFLVFGEKYRSCRGAKVYRNPDNTPKGAGFVRFADQTDQQRALVEMNKFTVNGKQILLKLAQPKFRAPRGRAAHQQYDPINYYPEFRQFYNSGNWQMYDYQQNPQSGVPVMAVNANVLQMPPPVSAAQQIHTNAVPQQTVEDARFEQKPPEGAPPAQEVPLDPDLQLEPYDEPFSCVEEANRAFMIRSEEFYLAMEQSRWCEKLQNASVHENDL